MTERAVLEQAAAREVQDFLRQIDAPLRDAYERLLIHAALPLVITPELLHYLRNTFVRDAPWVAEADILLAETLCQVRAYEQYSLHPHIRAYLLAQARARLGPHHLRSVAMLLVHYVQHQLRQQAGSARDWKTQEWGALMYLDEGRASVVGEIARAVQSALAAEGSSAYAGRARMEQLISFIEQQADELAAFPELVDFARLLANAYDGQAVDPDALTQMRTVAGVELPAAADVLQATRILTPEMTDTTTTTSRGRVYIESVVLNHSVELAEALRQRGFEADFLNLLEDDAATRFDLQVERVRRSDVLLVVLDDVDERAQPHMQHVIQWAQGAGVAILPVVAGDETDLSQILTVLGLMDIQHFRLNDFTKLDRLIDVLDQLVGLSAGAKRDLAARRQAAEDARRVYIALQYDNATAPDTLYDILTERDYVVTYTDAALSERNPGEQMLLDVQSSTIILALIPTEEPPSDWLAQQVYTAQGAGVPIIPVLTGRETSRDFANLEQLGLERIQAVRWSGREEDAAILADAVDRLLGAPESESAPPSKTVFINYTRFDREAVQAISAALDRAGVETWLDTNDILSGENWWNMIVKAIEQSGAMVVVMSASARKSEYVEREAEIALNLNKPVFVARLDDTPLPGYLADIAAIDLFRDFNDGLEALTSQIRFELDLPLVLADVMVPRAQITAVAIDTPLGQARRLLDRTGYHALPVYRENLDNITGILTARRVQPALRQKVLPDIADLLLTPQFFPQTMTAGEALRQLEADDSEMAIVIDDSGATVGLVTRSGLRRGGSTGGGHPETITLHTFRVVADPALIIRIEPDPRSQSVGNLRNGETVTARSDDRLEADGYIWWRHDRGGWSIERRVDGTEVYMVEDGPAEGPDTEAPADIERLDRQDMDRYNAGLALTLAQMASDVAAEVILLTQAGTVIAYTGQLGLDELSPLVEGSEFELDQYVELDEKADIRFVTLANGQDYMLYSRGLGADFVLSILLGSTMPVRDVRQQGTRLSDGLENNPAFLLLRAQTYYQQRQYEAALADLERLLKLDPDNDEAIFLTGRIRLALNDLDAALAAFQRCRQLDPNDARPQAYIGYTHRRLASAASDPSTAEHHWQEAERWLLSALEINPQLVDEEGESWWGTLGGLYRRQGRYEQAFEAYQRAQEVTPDSVYPAAQLARLHLEMGDVSAAETTYARVEQLARQALRATPDDVWAQADLALALAVQGRMDAVARLMPQFITSVDAGTLQAIHAAWDELANATTDRTIQHQIKSLIGQFGYPSEAE